MLEYHPIFAEDLSRLHQFGPKVLPGIFLGCVLHAVRIWKGDIAVADIEELEEMDASEIHARKLNAKEVFTPVSREKFTHIPNRRWNSQALWRRSGSENIHFNPGSPRPRRRTRKSSRRSDGSSSTPLDGEARTDLWSISGNFIYLHHVEPRVNLHVPRDIMSTEIYRRDQNYRYILGCNAGDKYRRLLDGWWRENYLMHGQASRDSFYWTKGYLKDINGPGGEWQENKRPPDQTQCGQKFGKTCPMERTAKRSKNGQSRNRSSTTPEDWVVSSSLNLRIKNSDTSSKMIVESWRFRCQQQCLVRLQWIAAEKPAAVLRKARQNTLVLLKPMNL